MALRYRIDDLDDFESNRSFESPRFRFTHGKRLVITLVAVGALVWLVGNSDSIGNPLSAPPELILSGTAAEKLEPGAPVTIGQVQIGEVIECGLEKNTPFARVRLEEEWMDRMTTLHRFEVSSQNPLVPGNVCVSVEAPPDGATDGVPLERGAVIAIAASTLPVEVPMLFYIVAGVAVLGLVTCVALSKAVVRVVVVVTVLGAIAAGACFLMNDPGAMQPAIDEASRLIDP